MARLEGKGPVRRRFVALAVIVGSLAALFLVIAQVPAVYSYTCGDGDRCWRFDTLPLILRVVAGGLTAALAGIQPWLAARSPLLRTVMTVAAFAVGVWAAARCLPDLAYNGPQAQIRGTSR
jgi:hypothetical protein